MAMDESAARNIQRLKLCVVPAEMIRRRARADRVCMVVEDSETKAAGIATVKAAPTESNGTELLCKIESKATLSTVA